MTVPIASPRATVNMIACAGHTVLEVWNDGMVHVPLEDIYVGDETPPTGTDIVAMGTCGGPAAQIVVVDDYLTFEARLCVSDGIRNLLADKDTASPRYAIEDLPIENSDVFVDANGTLVVPGLQRCVLAGRGNSPGSGYDEEGLVMDAYWNADDYKPDPEDFLP